MDLQRQNATKLYEQAQKARRSGDAAAALTHFRACLDTLRALDDKISQGRVLASMGEVHLQAKSHAEALECYEAALGFLDGTSAPQERALLLFRTADARQTLGQINRALEDYDEVIRLSQRLRDARLEGLARAFRGQITIHRGSPQQGLEQMLMGLVRLRQVKASETEEIAALTRRLGNETPELFERLVLDLCESKQLQRLLLEN